jgi:anti-sigma factor RsiW
MSDCDKIMESLGAWMDGALASSEAEAVRSHLEGCRACTESLRQLGTLQDSLKTYLASEASRIRFEPFWRGVQERLTETKGWREEFFEWLRVTFAAPRLAWAIPAVIALLLFVLSSDSFLPSWWRDGQRNQFTSVESIDAYGRNVALLREDETKTTVIWLYLNQEGENEASQEPAQSGASF